MGYALHLLNCIHIASLLSVHVNVSYSLILDEEKQAIMAYRSGEALQIPFFYPFICMKNIS